MDDDVAGCAAGLVLEAEPHPGMPVIPPGMSLRGGGIGKGEEARARTARLLQPLPEKGELVVEHLLDPLARDITGRLAVDRVADFHVVGRHRFGHRAGRAPDGEKPPRHLLAGPDLGERAVDLPVDVDGQGTLGDWVGGVAHRVPPEIGQRGEPTGSRPSASGRPPWSKIVRSRPTSAHHHPPRGPDQPIPSSSSGCPPAVRLAAPHDAVH